MAVGEIAQLLVERLRLFDICSDHADSRVRGHPSLFPHDLGPMGMRES